MQFQGFASAFYKYESSYAFMNIRSEKFLDKASKEFCINFQQWKERDLPATVDEAVWFLLFFKMQIIIGNKL
jgi:hypothetical protein